MTVTRFAPSPNGPLHWGHAYSAITAHDLAGADGGRFLLRIEDIDGPRSRPELADDFRRDLAWLGLEWDDVPPQSTRGANYQMAASRLQQMGLLYLCDCTRADIAAAATRAGPEGPVYPGTCRDKRPHTKGDPRPDNAPLRLNMTKALRLTEHSDSSTLPVTFDEACLPSKRGIVEVSSAEILHSVGDIVLARRDMGTSYHLSVVLDDAAQGITDVVRGADLFEATVIHVLLQELLGLPTPAYHHHALIRDDKGKRLAKRDDARAISLYRAQGATPADIRGLIGL